MSALAVLPPSPPATSSASRKKSLPAFLPKPTNNTPDDSPASLPGSSGGTSRKKVEFSPWTNVHQSATSGADVSDSVQVKPLLPSRQCQSINKSILKSNGQEEISIAGLDGHLDVKQSLSEVMDSIVQQLSKNDNIQAKDAYQTLTSAIKAYDELPDEAVLRSKLMLITRYIRQHLTALERPDFSPSDINLVTSALKVTVILVWNADFSPLLADDFRLFLLDRAVAVILEHSAPKSVIVHYLHLLAVQDFRPILITSSSRAIKLIDSLKVLSEHVKGNGVVSERLLVYQRLLDQARPTMKAKAALWVEPMLSAMSSTIPDTSNKALALGRKVCQAFPASPSISNAAKAALDAKLESGRSFGSSMCRRLEKMVMNKEDALHVPQIWAVVMLLCNSFSHRIDGWAGLKEWLMVIQRCFNSSNCTLRQQANMAWNRFVFVSRPHEASDSLLAMLAKPIVAQVHRSVLDKSSKNLHGVAMSSYCNLLYYAFRQSASHVHYTRAWNEYIVKVMRSSFFEKDSSYADIASRVLMALFWDAKASTKTWSENRAHEIRLVGPEELPTIDCKWTRNKSEAILELFLLLFKYSSWGLPASSDQAYVSKAWRHFLRAIRDAGSKEIKMSNETKQTLKNILSCLTKFGSATTSFPEVALSTLIRITVAELGSAPIIETLDFRHGGICPDVVLALVETLQPQQHRLLTAEDRNGKLLYAKVLAKLNESLLLQYQQQDEAMLPASSVELATRMLNLSGDNLVELILVHLDSGLAVWLKDEFGVLGSPTMERLAESFAAAIFKTKPETFETLDSSIAASMSSTHPTTVNTMAEIWNSMMNDTVDVAFGPKLSEALRRLSPYTDLHLPSDFMIPKQTDATHNPTPTNARKDEMQPSACTEQGVEAAEVVEPEQKAETANMGFTESAGSPQMSRHDDAQEDFVAVSSSSSCLVEESQLLTERQEEVRDRQRIEPAIVFPNLRSSPRVPSRQNSEPADCGFARKAATMPERPTTPTLPDQQEVVDAEVELSPTPKARLSRNMQDIEVPSSPPSTPEAMDKARHDVEEGSSPMQAVAEDDERSIILNEANESPEVLEALEADDNAESKDRPVADGGESEYTTASEGQKPNQTKDDNAQPPPQIEANKPTSAVPRTVVEDIPTSDLTWSNSLNSDELQELSASQLSQDLDWDAVLHGFISSTSASPASAHLEERSQPQVSPQPGGASPACKKRKRSSRASANQDGRSKRHKSPSSLSHLLVSPSQAPVVNVEVVVPGPQIKEEMLPQAGLDGDMLDTIDVTMDHEEVEARQQAASERTAASPQAQPSTRERKGKSKKGSRKSQRSGQEARRFTRGSSSVSTRSSMGSVGMSSDEIVATAEFEIPGIGQDSQASRTGLAKADLVASGNQKTDVAVQTDEVDHGGGAGGGAGGEQPAVLDHLQKVLDQVRNADADTVDLKALDELCFQIRFHAQAKAMAKS